jgi:hypothetical protein
MVENMFERDGMKPDQDEREGFQEPCISTAKGKIELTKL